MLVAAVGTFIAGFDQLVEATDRACAELGMEGFAQIGQSAVIPRHMHWERFLPQERLLGAFQEARVVVCHAGMGIVGEAMRVGAPVVLFPRKGATRKGHPANDQAPFAHLLAARHGLAVCERASELPAILTEVLRGPERRPYELATDVPAIVANWLCRSTGSSGNRR